MPPNESTQHKLDRVRRPRVHITYDVEIGGADVKKELPFVVGVLADLSGKVHPDRPLPKLRDRKFLEVDAENFDKVLSGVAPRLAYQVDNKLQPGEDSTINVELNFESMKDFEPEQIVRQVEPLRKLLEAREKLSDLINKMDGNDKLEELLQNVVNDTDALKRIRSESGRDGGGEA